MPAAGYKLFVTGDVLTAAQVNDYLMLQTVMVFANSAARTSALSGVLAEGLVSYLKDTDVVEIYTGAAWVSLDDPNAIQNSIVDAKGDLITATADNTPSRLAVGANATVLTADSTTATGLKWAAAASGMTLIKQAAFSNVANTGTTFDSMFSSTYLSYLVTIDTIYAATALDNLECQLLYSGSTQATGYYGSALQSPTTGSTVTITGTSNGTSLTLSSSTGASGGLGNGYFFISNCAPANALPNIIGMFNETNAVGQPGFFGGAPSTNQVYTGFRLKSSSSNITGTVSVYGLAK